MNDNAFKELIDRTKGKIFYVEFLKKDGTLRKMWARTGVRKGVKGVGMKYDPTDYGYRTVFDMQKKQFRMLNVNTISKLHFEGWRISRS